MITRYALFTTAAIVLAPATGIAANIAVQGDVEQTRHAGRGEVVNMALDNDGKKCSPPTTDAQMVMVPARLIIELAQTMPTHLLLGELARRGITTVKPATSPPPVGLPNSSADKPGSAPKPPVSNEPSSKPPTKPTEESTKPQ